MQLTPITMLNMAYMFLVPMLIGNVACTEGNSARVDHLANLIPGAGGYGSSNMDDNYDYILDDTPPRGKYFSVNISE